MTKSAKQGSSATGLNSASVTAGREQAIPLAEAILASTPDHVYVFDSEMRYRFASAAGARAFKLSPSEMVGRTWRELGFPGEIMEPFERRVRAVFASGKQTADETLFPLSDGASHHFQYGLAPLLDPEGHVESVVCSLREDTAHWRVHSALDAINRQVRSATGAEYLRELVVRLSNILGLRYVFIGEVLASNAGRIRSVATALNGALVADIEYDLDGTPCENVVAGETCSYPSGVIALFPRDSMLADFGAHAYLGTPLCDRSGRLLGLLATIHDEPIADTETTRTLLELFAVRAGAELERRESEAALHRTQQLLLTAERVGRSGSFEWELATNAVRWSPGTYELYGVDQATAPPVTFAFTMSFVHPEDVPAIERNVRHLLESGSRMDVRYRIRQSDGSWRAALGQGALLLGADGQPTHLVGTVQDWGEQEAASSALRASEARYRSVFEQAGFGLYRSTVDGRFLAANPELVRMLGYDSEDDLLRADMARDVYVRPEDRQRLIDDSAFAAGVVEPVEVEWRRKDGTSLTVRLRGSKGPGPPSSGEFTMTAEDVTFQRRLEDQLRQTQKLEGIGRLAGGIAHDFNNILTAITAYSDLLLSNLAEDDVHREDVQEIYLAAGRAAALTRQLLAFSRKQLLAPRVLDLETIVTAMHKMLRRIISEDITLTTDLRASHHVRADPTQVEQVLLNLVVNARDAMPTGGLLTIATTDRVVDGRTGGTIASQMTPGEYVTLSVTDTGVGMDADTMSRAFEPFFTTKPAGVGTGLGLATVYGVIKQSGGYIFASSTVGVGTTIDIHLPAVAATKEWPLPEAERVGNATGCELILLVEDDPGVRRVARLALARAGYEVMEAGSAHEALALVRGKEADIGLVLTDVVMPGMTGRELCDQLRLRQPGIRVLFISGYPGDPGTLGLLLEPGAPLLAKPFTASDLVTAVRTELDRAAKPDDAEG